VPTVSPSAAAGRPHSSSASSASPATSDAGCLATAGKAPGTKRMPTTVVPGSSTSTNGSVSGPITRGAEPTLQTSSTAPLGMRR
jgi:hypothetical protein